MSNEQDFRSELADFSGDYPPSVKMDPDVDPNNPQEAPSDASWAFVASLVAGEIVRFAEGRHPDYGKYPIIVVEDSELGVVSVHAFHAVLISALDENRAAPGERIGIRRLADREGDRGTYANYEVRFPDRTDSDGVPDFSKYRRQDTAMTEAAKDADG